MIRSTISFLTLTDLTTRPSKLPVDLTRQAAEDVFGRYAGLMPKCQKTEVNDHPANIEMASSAILHC